MAQKVKILTKEQGKFLDLVSQEKYLYERFYFTGGTPLCVFYLFHRIYDFYELLMKAKAKFDWDIDPIQLGSRLLLAKELKDYPRMLKKISHAEWKRFFLHEAKKLKKEIFKE